MKMRSILELIAVLAVGMATACWVIRDPRMSLSYSQGTWIPWFKDLVDGFVCGVGLAGTVFLWIERARGRSPLPWGPGRWAWSVVGHYVLLHYGLTYAYFADSDLPGMIGGLTGHIRLHLIFWLRDVPALVLVAVGLTYLAGASGPRPGPDSREWIGRILAVIVVVSGAVNPFIIGIGL